MAVLRLFAAAREAAGEARVEVAGATVADVLDAARERFGAPFVEVLERCRIWVNGQPAEPTMVLEDEDVVAVLPPVSGGSGAPGATLAPDAAPVLAPPAPPRAAPVPGAPFLAGHPPMADPPPPPPPPPPAGPIRTGAGTGAGHPGGAGPRPAGPAPSSVVPPSARRPTSAAPPPPPPPSPPSWRAPGLPPAASGTRPPGPPPAGSGTRVPAAPPLPGATDRGAPPPPPPGGPRPAAPPPPATGPSRRPVPASPAPVPGAPGSPLGAQPPSTGGLRPAAPPPPPGTPGSRGAPPPPPPGGLRPAAPPPPPGTPGSRGAPPPPPPGSPWAADAPPGSPPDDRRPPTGDAASSWPVDPSRSGPDAPVRPGKDVLPTPVTARGGPASVVPPSTPPGRTEPPPPPPPPASPGALARLGGASSSAAPPPPPPPPPSPADRDWDAAWDLPGGSPDELLDRLAGLPQWPDDVPELDEPGPPPDDFDDFDLTAFDDPNPPPPQPPPPSPPPPALPPAEPAVDDPDSLWGPGSGPVWSVGERSKGGPPRPGAPEATPGSTEWERRWDEPIEWESGGDGPRSQAEAPWLTVAPGTPPPPRLEPVVLPQAGPTFDLPEQATVALPIDPEPYGDPDVRVIGSTPSARGAAAARRLAAVGGAIASPGPAVAGALAVVDPREGPAVRLVKPGNGAGTRRPSAPTPPPRALRAVGPPPAGLEALTTTGSPEGQEAGVAGRPPTATPHRPPVMEAVAGGSVALAARAAAEEGGPEAFRDRYRKPPLAVVPQPGPRQGPMGVAWFLVTVVATVWGPVALGVWLAGCAAVAAVQTAAVWRARNERPLVLLAGLAAASLPVSAIWGLRAMTGVLVAAVMASLVVRLFSLTKAPMRDAALTLAVGVAIGLAVASVVLLRNVNVHAPLLLLVCAAAYDASAYLIGAGASKTWEGPVAGVFMLVPVTLLAAVTLVPPFPGASPLLLGLIAAVLVPCGPLAASALLGGRDAKAPVLRRLDSLLVVGPIWAWVAATLLR